VVTSVKPVVIRVLLLPLCDDLVGVNYWMV